MDKPCKFDHNDECLICDCWVPGCAWERLQRQDERWETVPQLLEMFKEYIEELLTKERS